LSAVLPYIYNCKILYLFDSIDLIHQTYRNFVDDYEISENDISIIQGENYKYDNKNNIILLSIKSYEKAFHIFPQVKIIVYDECHSSGRTELSQRITYSCQNASIHIGLSATPDRIKNPAEQLRLYANIGPIIYQKKILEQMEGNHISELEVNLYSMSLPNDDMIEVTGSYNDIYEKVKLNREMIKQAMKELFNITLKKANEMIKTYYDDDKRVDEVDEAIEYLIKKIKEEDDNNEVVKEDGIYYLRKFMKYGDESTHYILNDLRNNKIAEIAKKNKRVLILYNKIKHGEELKKRLPEAYLIHGKDSQEVRKEAEDYLRNNENAIVISSKIWNKGKDIPAIENYINAGGGVSEIEQIQKMGRVVRVSKDTGKGIAYVHDFEDKFSPLAIKQSNIRKRVYIKEGLNIIYHK
jgi:superfamily II DNA or RNA helicase